MSQWTHKPRRGDMFNDKSRAEYCANGLIVDIYWQDQEVLVRFWTKQDGITEDEIYTFDDLKGKWKERCRGVWVIQDDPPDWSHAFIIKLVQEQRAKREAKANSIVTRLWRLT